MMMDVILRRASEFARLCVSRIGTVTAMLSQIANHVVTDVVSQTT